MTFSYKRLWKLLIDRELSKKQLAELAGISQYTVNKLNKGESVTTETLSKICDALKCKIEDICEVESSKKEYSTQLGEQA
ncbi:helix-turn-helix transcriptional regulator [Lactococcus lactis subsp. lactis]|uniref:helix-turn-helix domain-containing protein n=1 Tax=Lactococcus lactis TaxID=1358 RepID=UPI002649E4C3|nr:helix-turn-helix transcriptional regulator [Lactococcus lactis]WKB47705.1 helix-turn-helix transcriptional regulator [Lactococcus lactis subsp. lactis]